MIREIRNEEIPECVRVIRASFMTVAEELGFTAENAPRFTAFATTEERLRYQYEVEKRPMYGFFSDSGELLGYYSLAKQSEQPWELNNLCVLPDHRHDGIGDLLLKDAFSRVKEYGGEKLFIGIVDGTNQQASSISERRSLNSSRSHADIWKRSYNVDTFEVTALCGHYFFSSRTRGEGPDEKTHL